MIKLPAPRQGLYALILLTSFLLLSCISLWTLASKHQQHSSTQAGEVLRQLSQELAMPLIAKDSLSLSSIAERYAHVPHVAGISVYDAQDTLMARIGDDSTSNASQKAFEKPILSAEKPMGKAVLHMQPKPLGQLVTDFWWLFAALVVAHILLWLAYVLTANQYVFTDAAVRPSVGKPTTGKQTAGALSDLPTAPPVSSTNQANSASGGANLNQPAQPARTTLSAAQRLRQQSSTSHTSQTTQQNTATGFAAKPVSSSAKQNTGMTTFLQALSAYDNPTILQIQFDDPKQLLTRLSPSVATPFYTLCNQLLDNAIEALTSTELTSNIGFERSDFAEDGVHVVVQSIDGEVDVAVHTYAAMLLAKLYTLLHEVTYTRHREIGRFALPVKACVSNKANQRTLAGILEYKAAASTLMVCTEAGNLHQLKGNMQLISYPTPTSVIERQTATVDGFDANLLNRITRLRDQILSA